jgi:hypothetical protein
MTRKKKSNMEYETLKVCSTKWANLLSPTDTHSHVKNAGNQKSPDKLTTDLGEGPTEPDVFPRQ